MSKPKLFIFYPFKLASPTYSTSQYMLPHLFSCSRSKLWPHSWLLSSSHILCPVIHMASSLLGFPRLGQCLWLQGPSLPLSLLSSLIFLVLFPSWMLYVPLRIYKFMHLFSPPLEQNLLNNANTQEKCGSWICRLDRHQNVSNIWGHGSGCVSPGED